MKMIDGIPADEMALARAIADTEAKNARFDALSPAKKRVAIAKDVLLWLRMGKLNAARGTYIEVRDGENDDWNEETPVVNGFNCTACALGGIFAAACERKSLPDRMGVPLMRGNSEDMRDALSPYFSKKQLLEIEAAFEGFEIAHVTFDHPARTFNADAEDAEERMVRIMKNIISNKGTFIP